MKLMKLPAVILVTLLLFLFVANNTQISATNFADIKNYVNTSSNGESSSVNVNIKNNVNTGSTNSSTSQSSTKVNISQEGEGTSQVIINGKEWKLEGPGEINVDESTNNASPTTGPTLNLTPTPTDETNLELENMIQTDEIVALSEELHQGILQKIMNFIEDLFTKIFNNN